MGQLCSISSFQHKGAYRRVGGLCHGIVDAIGIVRPVGRADGEAYRRRAFEPFSRPQRRRHHVQVARGRGSDFADRLWSYHQHTPTTVRPKTTPNILSSTCHAYHSIAVDRFLFAGCFQSRDRRECSKASGVSLQPLRGIALSVGIGVFLQRCATGSSWTGCSRTLLTSCCVCVW